MLKRRLVVHREIAILYSLSMCKLRAPESLGTKIIAEEPLICIPLTLPLWLRVA